MSCNYNAGKADAEMSISNMFFCCISAKNQQYFVYQDKGNHLSSNPMGHEHFFLIYRIHLKCFISLQKCNMKGTCKS